MITAVEPLHHVRCCPLRIDEHHELCRLHATLEEAVRRMEDVYSATTIESLLEERDGVRALCSCFRSEFVPA